MMKTLVPCLLSFTGLSGAARYRQQASQKDCYSNFDGKMLLSLSPCSVETVTAMKDMLQSAGCVDLTEDGLSLPRMGGCAEERAICSVEASEALVKEFGKEVVVVSPDAGAQLRDAGGLPEQYVEPASISAATLSSTFFNSFRGLADQNSQVDKAVQASNGAAKLEVIGTTWEGRPIRQVRVTGKGYRAGMPRVVVTFNVHAREWVAGMSGVYSVEQITAKARDDPSWLSGKEVVLIPMVNPDGFDYSTTSERFWRKNRNPNNGNRCQGVDVNRNFPVGYGGRYSTSRWVCSDTFIGTGALSEPESKAVASAIDEAPNSVYLDVHTYGRYILKPWSYTNSPHPRLAEVDEVGRRMFSAMKAIRNNRFQYGGNELLGEASGIMPDYTNGGLGFTFEMTTAFDPSTREILPSGKEVVAGIYEAIAWSSPPSSGPSPSPSPSPSPATRRRRRRN